ncbi:MULTISPECIES: hypothetical protein [unclassified Ensifer]|uniref:hypothetical protein n=1 Tax=unclassified Ensifer TaxID=2633371 RepID=UPI000813957A|nr:MULTISPECIES: hypothetical protein [unclassified Ensifer]OCP04861.1 hypothetical protein BC362_13900 [Ensifer sp. LC14]OCP08720.1 hypothetical protein BBX50_19500 [Ensifer sp. LC11]OCP09982.1 hypothetical protein BC374_19295 [Ensifer sp. LC13]OCP33056.1 hypothetical protein BC364_18230 [Ensifer sp. LC499]
MKMPVAHIWKTAVEAGRKKASRPDENLHIGKTMRDLYTRDGEEQSAKLERLLEKLRRRESMAKKK